MGRLCQTEQLGQHAMLVHSAGMQCLLLQAAHRLVSTAQAVVLLVVTHYCIPTCRGCPAAGQCDG